MQFTWQGFLRCRPRLLTLLVLTAIAVPGTLANLTYEIRQVSNAPAPYNEYLRQKAYGWPLTWRSCMLVVSPGPCGTIGWQYSAGRLAANAVLWVLMLAVAASFCEWMLRRYRPRPRWSLRTLLALVTLAAACCAWVAAARERALIQEPLIAEIKERSGRVVFERAGPRWLDVLGADRFRRHLVGVNLEWSFALSDNGEARLRRLSRLPRLLYLTFSVEQPMPGMASAVGKEHDRRGAPQFRARAGGPAL